MPELDFSFSILTPLEVAQTMMKLLTADPHGMPSEAVILHLAQAVIKQSKDLEILQSTILTLLAQLPPEAMQSVDSAIQKWLPQKNEELRASAI